jgi:hypothetical protein
LDKNRNRVKLSLQSGIMPYGNLKFNISINPKDSSDFEFSFMLRKLPAAMFNPYLISYTSFPLDRGTVEITGMWNVRDGVIRSNNNLQIIDARLANRSHIKDNHT